MALILMGGNVLTMDDRNARAEAVVVEDGEIVVVGANAEIAERIGPETTVVHLAGRTLMPGFMDPHNHFSLTSLDPVSVDCRTPPHQSMQSILEALAAAAKDATRGRWIRGWGFRTHQVRENRPLTRWEIDEVAPQNPVCIMDGSVHACYANSAALELAGIDRNTPDPAHGQFLREANGEPNGALWECGMNPVHALSLSAYLDNYQDSVADLVQANCMRHLACGITSIGDALVTPEAAQMYRRTDAAHKLPMVIHQMLGGTYFFAPPREAVQGELGSGQVSDRLRGGTVKIFMDPVFPCSAQIRYLSANQEERIGQPYYTQEEVNHLVLSAHRRNLQVAIHCLGNWAVEQALNAFEHAQREHPRAEPRFRIEHFTLTTPAQIRRARCLGVIASVQPPFVYTIGDRMKGRAEEMGGEALALPFRTMLDEGLTVAATSDSPCAPPEPLLGLHAMVTRRTRREGPPAGPEQAVTPLDGLRMYTINAAYAMSRDHEVGSLEAGKRADMVVLSNDPTSVDPVFIRDIVVEQTYVDGQLMHQH
jgi:predicted amidohydrolase YtcJ